jgi:choline dehydrogenase-like flavoprotein
MAAKVYDVAVGSGPSSGTLSAHRARMGVDVALVERSEAQPALSLDEARKAGFDSERTRGVGGKSLAWNAVAWRFSQRDFKGRSLEGAGEDWPPRLCGPGAVLFEDRA